MTYAALALGCVCMIQAFYLYRFARIILKTEEDVEASLDIIDESYQNIATVLDKPLFYDSGEVRQILNQLRNSRTALLYVANRMSGNSVETEVEPNA
jgi:hypothetical protein